MERASGPEWIQPKSRQTSRPDRRHPPRRGAADQRCYQAERIPPAGAAHPPLRGLHGDSSVQNQRSPAPPRSGAQRR